MAEGGGQVGGGVSVRGGPDRPVGSEEVVNLAMAKHGRRSEQERQKRGDHSREVGCLRCLGDSLKGEVYICVVNSGRAAAAQ
jgi:hypothetical protein